MEYKRSNFNNEEILQIFSLYSSDTTNPTILDLGGVANNNYRITNKTIDIVLKIYSQGQSDEVKIQQELSAIEKFSNSGLLVPKMVRGKNNKMIQKYKGFNVVASEYIEGTPYENLPFDNQRMKIVGGITGKVVKISSTIKTEEFECLSLEEEFFDVYDGIETVIRNKGYKFDLRIYNANLSLAIRIAKQLDQNENKHFIHKDIWPYNLIRFKHGTYLLDFNDWAIGPEIIELAVPILEFGMFKTDTMSLNIVKNILLGYKSVVKTNFSHSELWEAVLFICYLYFPYNVIQAQTKFESEIYLKRIKTLLSNRDIFQGLIL